MPIPIRELEEASSRYLAVKPAASLAEARASGLQTAYLSHSPKDTVLAEGLQVIFKERGWNLYLHWEQDTMSEKATRELGEKIPARIRQCDWFLFLATAHSTALGWCSWELGCASGSKPSDAILIVPTKDAAEMWHGSEFLQLYRHIDVTSSRRFGAFRPTEDRGVLIEDLSAPTVR